MFPAEKADHSETLPSTVHQTLLTLHTGKIQALCPQVSRSPAALSGPPARPHIRANIQAAEHTAGHSFLHTHAMCLSAVCEPCGCVAKVWSQLAVYLEM